MTNENKTNGPFAAAGTSLEEAALDWFCAMRAEDVSEADRAAFGKWCAADPRHRAAYTELCALWDDAGALRHAFAPDQVTNVTGLPERDIQVSKTAKGTISVRTGVRGNRRFYLGGAIAACLAFIIISMPMTINSWQADYLTGVGQQKQVLLDDGSAVWLNTDTAIAVDYTERNRTITLIRGEALFDVSKHPNRPFSVHAAGGSATALGTVYSVRKQGDSVRVFVEEGTVRVTSAAGRTFNGDHAGMESRTLSAGKQTEYRQGQHPVAAIDATDNAIAWRNGIVAIDALPLEDAFAEIDRYHKGTIILLADTDRLQPVTARLALSDLDGGLDALARTQDLAVTRLTDYLILVR